MKWKIQLTNEAEYNYRWICQHLGEQVALQVEKELLALADAPDPRSAAHVKPMADSGQCPGWYRLAIYTPVPLRIIFSLHQKRNGAWIEVHSCDKLEGGSHKLVTERMGLRGWVYNDQLDNVWRKRHG